MAYDNPYIAVQPSAKPLDAQFTELLGNFMPSSVDDVPAKLLNAIEFAAGLPVTGGGVDADSLHVSKAFTGLNGWGAAAIAWKLTPLPVKVGVGALVGAGIVGAGIYYAMHEHPKAQGESANPVNPELPALAPAQDAELSSQACHELLEHLLTRSEYASERNAMLKEWEGNPALAAQELRDIRQCLDHVALTDEQRARLEFIFEIERQLGLATQGDGGGATTVRHGASTEPKPPHGAPRESGLFALIEALTPWSLIDRDRPRGLTDEQSARLVFLRANVNRLEEGNRVELVLLSSPDRAQLSRDELVTRVATALEKAGFTSRTRVDFAHLWEAIARNRQLLAGSPALAPPSISPRLQELISDWPARGSSGRDMFMSNIGRFFQQPNPEAASVADEIWRILRDHTSNTRQEDVLITRMIGLDSLIDQLAEMARLPNVQNALGRAIVDAQFNDLRTYTHLNAGEMGELLESRRTLVRQVQSRSFTARGVQIQGVDTHWLAPHLTEAHFAGTALSAPARLELPAEDASVDDAIAWGERAFSRLRVIQRQIDIFTAAQLPALAERRRAELTLARQDVVVGVRAHPEAMQALARGLLGNAVGDEAWRGFDEVVLLAARHLATRGEHASMQPQLSGASADLLRRWEAALTSGAADLDRLLERLDSEGLGTLAPIVRARVETARFAATEVATERRLRN